MQSKHTTDEARALFRVVLRDALRHSAAPFWKTPEALVEYLGARPEGAVIARRLTNYPHSPGNTHWSTNDSEADREADKALRKKTRKELRTSDLQLSLEMDLLKGGLPEDFIKGNFYDHTTPRKTD